MLLLNYNLQTGTLVKGIGSPSEFRLPALYEGELVQLAIRGLTPTGNPAAPFAVATLTGAVVALSKTADGTVFTAVVSSSAFPAVGDHLEGNIAIPASGSGVVPAGVQYVESVLAVDLTTAAGTVHIESPCIIRRPAFAIAPPLTVENFRGVPGQGVPTGGTTGQVLTKASGADFDGTWTTPATGTTFLYRTLTSVSSSGDRQVIPFDRVLLDATTAIFTVTLPASPAVGTPLEMRDLGATLTARNVTVARNGQPINGMASDALMDRDGLAVLFVFEGGSVGWKTLAA